MLRESRLPSDNADGPNYYDLALALLPLPLLLGVVVGQFTSISTQTGVTAGAVLSAVALGHLLFGDPPTRRGPHGRFGKRSA